MSDVVHVPEQNRFELRIGDEVAVLAYEQSVDAVNFLHTAVPSAMEGQGVGGRLAEAGVSWARGAGFDVVPTCPFVRSWLSRHPDALLG